MPRPNILLIFTDQQRWDTIHASGNPVIITPNLDRLCKEGVTFTSAYTPSPVCVSARCSLIHGQYAHNTGCTYNGDAFCDDRPSIMDLLAANGYRTHGIGKMHFVPDWGSLRGFQTRLRVDHLHSDYREWLAAQGVDPRIPPGGAPSEMYYVPQIGLLPEEYHQTTWVGNNSVSFIQNQAQRNQPWFLFSSISDPHPPFAPPVPWHALYRGPRMPLPKMPEDPEQFWTYINRVQNRYKYRDQGIDRNLVRIMKAYYYASISLIDKQVGRMLETLEQTGQLGNTLVLFTSDHGEYLGDYDCFGKRGMHDSCCRVPMLVRFPQRFPVGQTCERVTSLVDVMPTFLRAAGLTDESYRTDGVDLAELAQADDDSPLAARTVYSQYREEAFGIYGAMNARWKYWYASYDDKEWLIDRQADPNELTNRAYNRFYLEDTARERSRLQERYRADGYERPLDGERWRRFDTHGLQPNWANPWSQPWLAPDPDGGLLIQDSWDTDPAYMIPGYKG